MKSFLPQEHALACHPETPSQSMRSIQARLSRARGGGIAIAYSLEGELSRLCLPLSREPGRAGGLWQHTCFEVFVSVKGAPAYREFNLAPSGEWAAYAFQGYRDGGPLERDLDPQIKMRIAGNRLELDALIRRECLPPVEVNARLLLALSAVIEEEGGVFSYWALKHPPGRPDFHHAEAFVLEIDLEDVAAAVDPAYTGKP